MRFPRRAPTCFISTDARRLRPRTARSSSRTLVRVSTVGRGNVAYRSTITDGSGEWEGATGQLLFRSVEWHPGLPRSSEARWLYICPARGDSRNAGPGCAKRPLSRLVRYARAAPVGSFGGGAKPPRRYGAVAAQRAASSTRVVRCPLIARSAIRRGVSLREADVSRAPRLRARRQRRGR
jgi:hypothetical protein